MILTSILFLGPITSTFFDGSWKDMFSEFKCTKLTNDVYIIAFVPGAECWKTNLHDILWIRNQIVAPISEEFTFRACMLPQLLNCYSTSQAVLVSPLFFGVGTMTNSFRLELWKLRMLFFSSRAFPPHGRALASGNAVDTISTCIM